MENFRSMSCRDGRISTDFTYENQPPPPGPRNMQGLRSYSVSHGARQQPNEEVKAKKQEHVEVVGSRSWGKMNFDPELQRKKRVVSYKAYAMEGKMKGSLKKSFRWIKDACNQVVHGWK
ncbi:unnamed protein product [Linum trigynum]|uniref:DUF3511 domain protein n=1 Tax=Linum trigynum TaxID=586398 RepID=A0AAV2DSR0_9ROSI